MPTHTLPNPTLTPDLATNSLKFDFGTFNSPANIPGTIDLVFTVVANAKPFADGLFLTNLAQECEKNTFGVTFCQVAVAQVKMREPKLRIRKGVIATDNPHGVFSQPASPQTTPNPTALPPVGVTWINSPGGSCLPRFLGTIHSNNLGSLIKSDLSNVDANDLATFAIVIENTGGHPAYNVQIEDIIPLSNFNIIPGSLCIRYGDNTALIPGAGGSSGASTTINLGFGAANPIPEFHPTNGTNIVIITFDVKLNADVKSGCADNLAKLKRYTSIAETADADTTYNFVNTGIGGPFSDTAQVCVAPKARAKCIVATSEAHTIPQIAPPGTPPVAIGEVVRYRLIATVPEGVSPNYQITDLLPPGLTYLGNPRVAFVESLALGDIASTTVLPAPLGLNILGTETTVMCPGLPTPSFPFPAAQITVAPGSGGDVAFNLGTVTNTENDGSLELVIIEFNALVGNSVINQDTSPPLPNSFQVKAGTQPLPPVSVSNPVFVKIVEPKLTITKLASAPVVAVGNSVTYTVTITNTGTATAFDVVVKDLLAECLGTITPNNISWSVNPTANVTNNSTPSNLHLTISQIPVGGTATIAYKTTIKCIQCDKLVNKATVTWTSLPWPQGTCPNPTGPATPPGSCTQGSSGAINGERNGTPPHHAERLLRLSASKSVRRSKDLRV